MLSYRIIDSRIIPDIKVLNDFELIGQEDQVLAVQLYDYINKNPYYINPSSTVKFRFRTTTNEILEVTALINPLNASIISISLTKNQTLLITGKELIVKIENGTNVITLVRDRIIKKVQYLDNVISGDEITDLPAEVIIEGDVMNILQDCYNSSGMVLTRGKVVYLTGNANNEIALATNNETLNKAQAIGIVNQDIPNGGQGTIQINGTMDITYPFDIGTELYLSTNGDMVSTVPETGYIHFCGTVTHNKFIIDFDLKGSN